MALRGKMPTLPLLGFCSSSLLCPHSQSFAQSLSFCMRRAILSCTDLWNSFSLHCLLMSNTGGCDNPPAKKKQSLRTDSSYTDITKPQKEDLGQGPCGNWTPRDVSKTMWSNMSILLASRDILQSLLCAPPPPHGFPLPFSQFLLSAYKLFSQTGFCFPVVLDCSQAVLEGEQSGGGELLSSFSWEHLRSPTWMSWDPLPLHHFVFELHFCFCNLSCCSQLVLLPSSLTTATQLLGSLLDVQDFGGFLRSVATGSSEKE